MKIFLFGYGQMGREIEEAAVLRGHEIIGKYDPVSIPVLDEQAYQSADAIIEYTQPAVAPDNILRCLKDGKVVVSGTTGWYERLAEMREACSQYNATLFYSPNFSLGVNLFFRLNKYLASLMKSVPSYELSLEEVHHPRKKDAPSGTAIKLAEGIIENLPWKTSWTCIHKREKRKPDPLQLPVYYDRVEGVVGIHTVEYTGADDMLSIRHEAFSRKGFALGTLIATEWVSSRKGFFNMDDLLNSQL